MNDTKTVCFEKAAESLEKAKRLMVNGEMSQADEELNDSVEHYETRDALLLRIVCGMLTGKSLEAWKDYRRLYAIGGERPEASAEPREEKAVLPISNQRNERMRFRNLAAVLAVVGLMVVIGIQSITNAATSKRLEVARREKEAASDRLETTASRYRLVTESSVTTISGGIETAAVFTSEMDPREPSYSQATGTAEVVIENQFLPILVSWRLGEGETIQNAVGVGQNTTLELPTGHAVFFSVRPLPEKNWIQPYGVSITRDGVSKYFGSTVGETVLTLKHGDKLHIQMSLPSPPWNATLLLLQDHWAMVTLERPDPTLKVESFLAGEPDIHGQPLPNTMVVWQTIGTEAIANELAHLTLNTPSIGKNQWGRWRGNFHVSLTLPFDGETVPPLLNLLSKQELATKIRFAMDRLRVNRNRSGVSVGELLETAKEELLDRPELSKKILEVVAALGD